MSWLALAAVTAIFDALRNLVMKSHLQALPPTFVAWAWVTSTVCWLLPVALRIPLPPLDPALWCYLLMSVLLNTSAVLLYAHALQRGDLSNTMPMIAFTPLFLLLTSPLILGELPTLAGFIGVALVVAGSYLLNIRERNHGYFAPYRALLRETGSRLMLGVALIWSIAANIDKLGIQASSPLLWVVLVNSGLSLTLLPLMLRHVRQVCLTRRVLLVLVFIGLLDAIALYAQMTALTLTLVAYVIAVKRTSIVISVVLGAWLFGEPGFRERFAGALVMLAGVLCMLLA